MPFRLDRAFVGLAALVLLSAGSAAAAPPDRVTPDRAAEESDDLRSARQLVERARLTVDRAKSDKEFGGAPTLLKRARAVLVVPELVKGGFVVGAEGGRGVLLARNGESWGRPAFYTLASASLGFQIGIQTAEMVMFVMTERALNALRQEGFKFGAQASLAIVTLGSNVQAGSTTDLNADIYVWAKAAGAYAGLTLEGSGLQASEDLNRAFYGRDVTAAEILSGQAPAGQDASGLRTALGS